MQDGLSTSVAMTVKSACVCIAMIVVMFTYSWRLTIYAILLILPAILFNRIFMNFMMKYNVSYQAAKADLSSSAQENIGNIRTLKAFADEKGAVTRYSVLN